MPVSGGHGGTSTAPVSHGRERSIVTQAAHHEIHRGKSYEISAHSQVASASKLEIVFTTPASPQIHAVIDTAAGGEFTVEIEEGIGAYTGGSDATAYNRNRNADGTSVTGIKSGSLTYTAGTVIHGRRMGLGKDGGSDSNYQREWILKASTRYAFRVTSHASSNPVSVIVVYYEHD